MNADALIPFILVNKPYFPGGNTNTNTDTDTNTNTDTYTDTINTNDNTYNDTDIDTTNTNTHTDTDTDTNIIIIRPNNCITIIPAKLGNKMFQQNPEQSSRMCLHSVST